MKLLRQIILPFPRWATNIIRLSALLCVVNCSITIFGTTYLPGDHKPNALQKPVLALRGGQSNALATRKLRCALFAWESLHSVAEGGVAPHVTELAAGLERRGHEVHLFVRSAKGQAPYSRIHGVHVHCIPYGQFGDIIKDCNLMCQQFVWLVHWLQLYQPGFRFDVLHAHDWLAATVITAAREAGWGDMRMVVTMHSTEWGRCGQKYARWKCEGPSGSIRDVEEAACRAADRVICVSGILKDEVGMLYAVPEIKMRTIYNGIHVNQYEGRVDPGQIKRGLGMDWFNPMILFVGRLATQKGPDVLLEAVPDVIKNVTQARFVFVGSGHMMPELKKRTEELGAAAHVLFLGAKTGPELKALEMACDCMVVPSRNEPFGIVVLECWACAKPVIATTSGGPREFVSDGEDGYLSPPEPANISAAIVKLLSNWTDVQRMGARGRAKVEAKFNWDGIAAQTEEVYQS